MVRFFLTKWSYVDVDLDQVANFKQRLNAHNLKYSWVKLNKKTQKQLAH